MVEGGATFEIEEGIHVSGFAVLIVLLALLILAVAGLIYARWANRRSGTNVE